VDDCRHYFYEAAPWTADSRKNMKRKKKPERQAGCDSNCYRHDPELGMCKR